MPKKLLILLFLIILFLISDRQVFSAVTPTGEPTCDLCGWCNRLTNPKPPDWTQCNLCLYDSSGNEITGNYYTVLGCISTKPEKYVQFILSIVFGAAGGIAFMAVLWGSATVLTSAGNPEKIQAGKDLITSSILGILIIVFSVFLLRVIGFDILKIPGFG
ncbi:hypothetical protein A3D78_03730 [Candidatus Gottesmanbacteria bacterium RIFCSPHIGHO2_02_FULL_39_14]|uniref:Uncharacterized protein n=2 Tax=Candidatus Gottesmaniibacteriota TaxID=1752720 RepID=A0A1F5ZXI4_9BACT|nr:MAG: hypothetical protein A2153_02255 [Candidatus Gottesmanbacteria bacterium RBG_16_38_7b]OGG17150.1 MAG: hypothetical protein A3D78_03730 [Candidatus Gottesmanbacteria bacterium RIFCSPHIGHO2_02_FULL_39_14]